MITTYKEDEYTYIFVNEIIELSHLKKEAKKYFTGHSGLKNISSVSSGRTKISVFKSGEKSFLIRKYYHGGIFQEILKDNYFNPARFIKEMLTLIEAARAGIKTVKPAGIVIRKTYFFYKAIIVTEYLPDSKNLAEYIMINKDKNRGNDFKIKLIETVSEKIAYFHNKNFYHPDLHLKNILLKENGNTEVYIIDFDRVTRLKELPLKLRADNILRFIRSIIKFNRKYKIFNLKDEKYFIERYIKHSNINKTEFLDRCRWSQNII